MLIFYGVSSVFAMIALLIFVHQMVGTEIWR